MTHPLSPIHPQASNIPSRHTKGAKLFERKGNTCTTTTPCHAIFKHNVHTGESHLGSISQKLASIQANPPLSLTLLLHTVWDSSISYSSPKMHKALWREAEILFHIIIIGKLIPRVSSLQQTTKWKSAQLPCRELTNKTRKINSTCFFLLVRAQQPQITDRRKKIPTSTPARHLLQHSASGVWIPAKPDIVDSWCFKKVCLCPHQGYIHIPLKLLSFSPHKSKPNENTNSMTVCNLSSAASVTKHDKH